MATKSVILIDFDNIFLGLWRADQELALRFGNHPLEWLALLADRHLTLETRRWLVARAYLNPQGWVDAPNEPTGRIPLHKFRASLVRAGFEVVDCPSLTRKGKNAADIRIVIDTLDLMASANDYQEFVIGSGDADFAPLLLRLRANDRRTTIISPRSAAVAYTSLADRIIDFAALDALVRPELVASETPVLPGTVSADAADAAALQRYLRDRLASSMNPLNLSTLAKDAGQVLPGVRASRYCGAGTFVSALRRLDVPALRISQHFVWDDEHHDAPAEASAPAVLAA